MVLVDVQLVADSGELAVPDLFAVKGVQEGERHSSALGDDPDSSAAKDVLHRGERRGQTVRGIHDPDAIGTDETNSVAPRTFLQFPPELSTAFVVFPEAAALDDHPANTFAAALVHDLRDCAGRRKNDSQVYRVGDLIHRAVDLAAEQYAAVWPDQMDLSRIPEFQQILGNFLPQIGWPGRHTDNHYRRGKKEISHRHPTRKGSLLHGHVRTYYHTWTQRPGKAFFPEEEGFSCRGENLPTSFMH